MPAGHGWCNADIGLIERPSPVGGPISLKRRRDGTQAAGLAFSFEYPRTAIWRVGMNEGTQLASAMLVMVFAAVMLIAGQLYIESRESKPLRFPTAPAVQMASFPL